VRVAFIDESGRAGDTEFVGMAACDARWPVWQEFNRRWSAALANHGAPFLHMKDFAGLRGPYGGWEERQRKALMADCLGALDGLAIDMTAVVARPADADFLSPEEKSNFDDPYLWVFQDCLYALALAGYMDLPGERVHVIYSQQDEFRSRFRRMFALWKTAHDEGSELGRLDFVDMRRCPALQLADLLAYELTHYYHLRATRPDLKMRYPLVRLCAHQNRFGAGGFKYIPSWKLRLQLTGSWQAVQDVLWSDIDTWMPLLQQLAPEENWPERKIRRIALLRASGAIERLKARQIRKRTLKGGRDGQGRRAEEVHEVQGRHDDVEEIPCGQA
jgi:hypothetical protein